MKSGMPVLFASGGKLGDALFLCLPDNPVSVLATYLAPAQPRLDQLQGRAAPRPQWYGRLAEPWRSAKQTTERHSLMRISSALFSLTKKNNTTYQVSLSRHKTTKPS